MTKVAYSVDSGSDASDCTACLKEDMGGLGGDEL